MEPRKKLKRVRSKKTCEDHREMRNLERPIEAGDLKQGIVDMGSASSLHAEKDTECRV
jgi:hypothetical protein